jgi:methionine biosynthesis protein MetW
MNELRPDLQIIASWIEPGSRVLDIGCGSGRLIAHLMQEQGVKARGIELEKSKVNRAIAAGLPVIEGDVEDNLPHFSDQSFDYVVISQALQAMEDPRWVLSEMVRIGKQAICSVPNFGYWKNRAYLGLKGRMPVTSSLSYQWYETPNIHFCTLTDFVELAEIMGLTVERQAQVKPNGKPMYRNGKSLYANLLSEQGVFSLVKR